MIKEALKGLGLVAYGDPAPGAGVYGTMSSGERFFAGGNIKLVSSAGRPRSATYRDIYLLNPWVYSAANIISMSIGRMPISVFGFDADANKQRYRYDLPQTPGRPSAGVQLDRMLSAPSQNVSRMSSVGNTLRERLILGNALWEIKRDLGGGIPTGLEPVSWLNVNRVEEDGWGNPLWYEIAPRGKAGPARRLFPQDVIHFGCGSEFGQATGISLLESCHHTLALHEALMRHLLAYFENSARGSGHFKVDNPKQAAEARKLITELYTSPENAGKVLITNATWQSMSDTPEHASIVELISESRTEVAAAFRVPPPVLGLLEHAIRANVKEMREQFVRDTVGPWTADFSGDIQAQLVNPTAAWSNLFVEFDLNEQLRPDLEARAMVYQRMMFVFSIDEIRGMEGKSPFAIKGLTDVPLLPSGVLPGPNAAGRTPKGGRVVTPQQEEAVAFAGRFAAELEAFLEANAASRNGHRDLSMEAA